MLLNPVKTAINCATQWLKEVAKPLKGPLGTNDKQYIIMSLKLCLYVLYKPEYF